MVRIVAIFDLALKVLAGTLVVCLLATVMAGVGSRLVNQAFAWTDELSGYLMVWLASAGWMIGSRNGSHIRIRVVQDLLKAGLWRQSERAIQAATLVLGVAISWFAAGLVMLNQDVESTTLPVSTAWLYAPLVAAGALTAIQSLVELIQPRRPASTSSAEERIA
jgi:TRAP-type C4-dicarboxylate transport system permease small subunit